MTRTFLRHAALAALCTLPAFAQSPDGPYWTSQPLPPGSTVRALGSLLTVQTPSQIHLYSGLLRRWTLFPLPNTANVTVTNRYVLMQDGTNVHAWSAATGKVVSLVVSPGAIVDIGSASSSWAALVIDGTTVQAFSGFLGQWVATTLSGPLLARGVASHTALVADATQAQAFSAFYGTWVATPTRAGATYATFRSGAFVALPAPDEVHAFSAYQNRWTTTALPGATGALQGFEDGYATLTAGNELALFSTMSGNWLRRTFTSPPALTAAANVLVVQDGGNVHGYAPATDAFVPLPNPGPNGRIDVPGGSLGSYALIDDGNRLTAFSGLTGRVAPGPIGTFTLTLGDAAALAQGAAAPHWAYSALVGIWVPAPATTVLTGYPTFESMIVATPTGFDAFSARTLQWASLAVGAGSVVHRADGALFAIAAPTALHVFDPRLTRWQTEPANNASLVIHRTVGIAHDATRAYGYALFHGEWESVPLQGQRVNHVANSSIGYVVTTTHVHVFTGNGSLSNWSRFPEFSRFVVRGGTLEHMQAGPAGALVAGLFGGVAAEIPLGALGTLRVDPASALVLPLGAIPADGMLRTSLPIPVDPALNGLTLHMQDLVVPVSGAPFLTNASSPIVW